MCSHSAILAAFLVSAALPVTAFELTRNGEAAAAIVIPSDASPVAVYAAEELRYHIRQAAGCDIPILRDSVHTGETDTIQIGPTRSALKEGLDRMKLSKNEFVRKTAQRTLFLFGIDGNGTPPMDENTPQGTLTAVYDFCADKLGVRWLWPGELGTYVPKRATISAGPPGIVRKKPRLLHARIRDTVLGKHFKVLTEEELAKLRLERAAWMRRNGLLATHSFQYGHAYTKYWERFGNTHSEYFALRPDGKRGPANPKRPELVQMCVSNPGLIEQIVADWRIQRRHTPERPWVNGCENDRTDQDPFCVCEACRKMDAPGSSAKSDRYARFWLALQKAARSFDPRAVVIGLAYSDYAEPPLATRLNPDILVGIVPRISYPLDPEERARFRKLWLGWAETQASLFFRPNCFLQGFSLPYIFAREFAEDLRFAAKNGMTAADFDSLTGMWATQGLNYYMLARLLHNPEDDPEAIFADYCAAFGAASSRIRDYFLHWEKITKRRNGAFRKQNPQGGWNSLGISGDLIYTEDTIPKASALLKEASECVRNDQEAAQRVEFLQKGLTHTILTLNTMRAWRAWKADEKNTQLRSTFRARLRELDDFRETIKHGHVINALLLRQLEAWNSWRSNRAPE